MANTIKNFLIGLGLDTSNFDEGERKATSGLNRIKTVAGFAGAAMVGAFATASSMAIAAGSRIDRLALSTERFNTSTSYVYNLGNALRVLGGDASEAVDAIDSIESKLADFKLAGSFGALDKAVLSGADVSALLQAQTGEEFFRMLSDMVPDMTKDQQRMIQESFGFSDATMRSLRMGGQQLDILLSSVGDLTGSLDGATASARAYNAELTEFQLRLEGIANTLAERMLPAFTGILSSVNTFIDDNQSFIDGAIDTFTLSPGGSAIATGGATAALSGKAASAIGMKSAGKAISRLGVPGMVVGGGMMAWPWAVEQYNNRDQSVSPSFSGGASYRAPKEIPIEYRNLIDNDRRVESQPEPSFSGGASYRTPRELSPEYRDMMGGSVDSQEAIRATPEFTFIDSRSSEKIIAPTQTIQNNLDVNLTIDGKALESTVTGVIERRDQATIDDMQSTTAR